jgi:hypothetical protein
MEDLRPFIPQDFAEALFDRSEEDLEEDSEEGEEEV